MKGYLELNRGETSQFNSTKRNLVYLLTIQLTKKNIDKFSPAEHTLIIRRIGLRVIIEKEQFLTDISQMLKRSIASSFLFGYSF